MINRRSVLVMIPLLSFAARLPAATIIALEQFGAVGDGRADDTAAWVRAIEALRVSGGVLRGRPGATYAISRTLQLNSLHDAQLIGNGATLFRRTTGTAAGAIALLGSENVLIEGWKFDSSYDGYRYGSTGSNPNIFLGVGHVPNRSITVRNNSFTHGNHANITIGTTRIDSLIPPFGVANEDIAIEGNRLGNAGSGVFVYKGTRRFRIEGNSGSKFSSLAIGLDTHAATDPDRQRYRIENGLVRANSFTNVRSRLVSAAVSRKTPGHPRAFAARGILVKGDVVDTIVELNEVNGVVSSANVETYGILVTPDQATPPASPSRIQIEKNTITGVRVSAPGASAAWAMGVGSGATAVSIVGNRFSDADRGVRLSGAASWDFRGNVLENLATLADFPLQVTRGQVAAVNKRISGNQFVRGSGHSSIAIQASGAVDLQENSFAGFKKDVTK